MQYVFNNYEEAKQLGIKGAKSINAMLNPKVIGEKIKSRLEYNVQSMQSTLSPIHAELYQRDLEIYRLKNLVDAMESSKFWQMRKQWFKLKRMLKIKVIE